jgi:hypothetical protein
MRGSNTAAPPSIRMRTSPRGASWTISQLNLALTSAGKLYRQARARSALLLAAERRSVGRRAPRAGARNRALGSGIKHDVQPPRVNPVGVLESPPEFAHSPRSYSVALRVAAIGVLGAFLVTGIATTVYSFATYCITTQAGAPAPPPTSFDRGRP